MVKYILFFVFIYSMFSSISGHSRDLSNERINPSIYVKNVISDYEITFTDGKISLRSLKLGSLIENNEDFPLIEPVILHEKTKYSRGSIFITPKIKGVAKLVSAKILMKSDDAIKYEYAMEGKCSGSLIVSYKAVSKIAIEIDAMIRNDNPKSKCNAIKVAYKNIEQEIYSGIGTQVTNMNLNGKRFMSLSQEQGHGKGKQPITWIGNKLGKGAGGLENFSYSAIPHYISNKNRSFWVNTKHHVHFDFTKVAGTFILSSRPEINIRINHHASPKLLLAEFAKQFGVMKPLPDWTHKGAMLGIQGGSKKIIKALADLNKHNAKISSVWIQDWVGTRSALFSERLRWNWRLDREKYPNWEKLIQGLTEKNLKVLTYFNPRLISGTECGDPCDFDEALRKGYLVNNMKGNTYFIGNGGFDFAKVDLTNEEAVLWFQSKISDHIKMAPVSGWMVDFSESLPFDAKLSNGMIGRDYHNLYIEKWGKINREVADDILGEDAFLFMRGGILGSHTLVNAYWLGDQLMSWDKYDGMHSALIGSITSGLSGATVNHSDIGGMIRVAVLGYKISRDRELFLKWLQMNAFSPILRTHEGTLPALVHQFDSDEYTLKQFAYYTRLFAQIYDYRRFLLKVAQREGIPLQRGLFLEYPNDERTWRIDDQIMLGSDILIAPIFNKKAKNRTVYLPKGEWIDLFSSKEFTSTSGIDVLVAAKLESIPVFVKKDSAVGIRLLDFIKNNPPPKL